MLKNGGGILKEGIYEQVINNEIISEVEVLDINNLLISKEDIDNDFAVHLNKDESNIERLNKIKDIFNYRDY